MTKAAFPTVKVKPALLTRHELDYLQGKNTLLSKYQIRQTNYRIREKLKTFEDLEKPLLVQAGFMDAIPPFPLTSMTKQSVTIAFKEADFVRYLRNTCAPQTIKQRLTYAKRYGYVLDTGDATNVLSLGTNERLYVMKALAVLEKFQGRYDYWKSIRQKYDLKWTGETSVDVFNRLVNESSSSYSSMLQWVKTTTDGLPSNYGNIILFTTLTGLRASESLSSIRLIKTDFDNYFNKNTKVIEHFKYPNLFLRRTKKAFISIANQEITELAKSCQDVDYAGFRSYLKRRKYETNLKYCRMLFATHLRKNGIESELIDLLQGRLNKSVFARHYFRPDFDKEVKRVSRQIMNLKNEIGTL